MRHRASDRKKWFPDFGANLSISPDRLRHPRTIKSDMVNRIRDSYDANRNGRNVNMGDTVGGADDRGSGA